MMAFQPHPTQPHHKLRFRKFTGRSQLLGVPMAWRRRRQAMAKWRCDEEGGADLDRGRTRTWGARTQRHLLRPQRHLAMAWRRRHQGMGTPNNWERPVTGNAQ